MAKKGRFITSCKIGQANIQKWGLDVLNPERATVEDRATQLQDIFN